MSAPDYWFTCTECKARLVCRAPDGLRRDGGPDIPFDRANHNHARALLGAIQRGGCPGCGGSRLVFAARWECRMPSRRGGRHHRTR